MIDTRQCFYCINQEYNQFGPYCYILYPPPHGDDNGICDQFEDKLTGEHKPPTEYVHKIDP